jgi:hypothetical protein
MKTLKQLNKKDKIDLLAAIKNGEIDPTEINENTVFCTGSVFYDNLMRAKMPEEKEPIPRMLYIGEGIPNLANFLKSIEENRKAVEKFETENGLV